MNQGYISLSQLTRKIEMALKDPALYCQWVTFEIKSLTINQSNGHCYLELVEKSQTGVTIASARGTIWCSTYFKISSKFRAATSMELQRGMKILGKVSVNYHSVYGISINILDIDPIFTLGESERIRRETIQRLYDDGIMDMNQKIPIPSVITKIAVVSSPTAAGYGDFCKQIKESGLNISITLFESIVQGERAGDSIMNSLEKIMQDYQSFDVITIIRGGGASGDLDCFDEYMVCSAIAQMPLPVLTGIGHDRDTSIADMVAAVPLKTPTATAAWIININIDFLRKFEDIVDEIVNKSQNILLGLWRQVETFISALKGRTGEILSENSLQISEQRNRLGRITALISSRENEKVTKLKEGIRHSSQSLLNAKSMHIEYIRQNISMKWKMISQNCISELDSHREKFDGIIKAIVDKEQTKIDSALKDLANTTKFITDKENLKIRSLDQNLRSGVGLFIERKKEKESNILELLKSHDPTNVLKKGYAIIKKDGHVMPESKGLNKGDIIDIVLRDATIKSEIK